MAGQSFEQSQSLGLNQTIAPQMQQSLQVLQAPTMELRNLVRQEIESNCTLEDETSDPSIEEVQGGEDEEFDKEFAELSQLDQEWREYLAQSRSSAPRRDDADEKYQFVLDSIVSQVTLQEHLTEQLVMADAEKQIKDLARMLIGNIGENGFLQTSLDDLCFNLGIPMAKLVEAKELVQSFDPPGIGAENLRESLLIQLERLGKHHSLEYRIIDNHLDEFAKHRFPAIAKKLGVSPEQVSGAAESIANLDPKPGSQFVTSKNTYVSPDVSVEKMGDEWVVAVNNESIPRLRISNSYKDIMSQAGSSQREVRSYIREKIRSGKFLIRSIHQRQQTIENIAKEIVKRQQEFFEHGSSMLKPMNMAEVADAVGVHETTVSRAVNGKYMSTPHGVLELKYFFTTGYETEDGDVMSNTSVKEALADLVANEDPKKPLSDAKLVDLLREKGLKIARRTVAKYRDELHILPSHMRKTY